MSIPFDVADRFSRKYLPVTESGCWLWEAATDKDGYGIIQCFRSARKAHRVSWEIYIGPIPAGLMVLHKCDTPPCVNPAHLFVGDAGDNARDKFSKGRENLLRGARNRLAKLTDEKVIAILKDDRSRAFIAAEYGISPGLVSAIKRGERWAHVSRPPHVPEVERVNLDRSAA